MTTDKPCIIQLETTESVRAKIETLAKRIHVTELEAIVAGINMLEWVEEVPLDYKTCSTCKHYRKGNFIFRDKCYRKMTKHVNPINGNIKWKGEDLLCTDERMFRENDETATWVQNMLQAEDPTYFCGKTAQYWTPL